MFYNGTMNKLDDILKEKAFALKFNRFYPDFCIESVGYDDFQYVEEIGFFRKQPFYTLHYVLRGKGILYFRGKCYRIQSGQYFLLPPNENIKYLPDKNDPWKYFWFDFGGNLASAYFEEIYDNSPIITHVPESESYSLFKRLFHEIAETGSVKYYSALSCFYSILNCLSEDSLKHKKVPFVDNAKSFMELNYQSAEFNVDALCRMVHVSHSYLCKIFHREEGMTVKSYLNTLRMNEALRLLKNSELSVKEISFRVGFSDEVIFMKAFKKFYGKTPSEYRHS